MQRKEIRSKQFFLWGLEGSILGGVIYFLILLLNDKTPEVLDRLSFNSSYIFAIILVFIIFIIFGLIYSILMIQLESMNVTTTNDLRKTLALGLVFGLFVYFTKVFAVFSFYLGLPTDTAIMGLIELEKETWLELIGDIIFGIVIALIVQNAYKRYSKRFKSTIDSE